MINTLSAQSYTPNIPLSQTKKVSNRQFSLDKDTVSFSQNTHQQKSSLQISFAGLTKTLSGKLFNTNKDIKELLEKETTSDYRGIVGNLPKSWVNKLSENNKETEIKQIYTAFSDAANLINSKFQEVESLGFKNEDLPKLEPELSKASQLITNALQEQGLIKDKTELGFEHVGQGRYGITFKFNVDDQLYIYKVFFVNAEQTSSELTHGVLKEINRAAFIKKHVGPCQYPELFFADIKSGFMITRLINNDSKAPLFIEEKSYGAENGDVNEEGPNKGQYVDQNVINGYVVDYGGIRIDNKLLATNKTVRWVYKQFKDLPGIEEKLSKWNDLYKTAINNKVPNCKDIMIGLIDYAQFLPRDEQLTLADMMVSDDKLSEDMLLKLKPYIIEKRASSRYQFSEMERSLYFIKLFNRFSDSKRNDLLKEINNLSGFYITEIFSAIAPQLDEQTKEFLANEVRHQFRYEAQWKEAVDVLYNSQT